MMNNIPRQIAMDAPRLFEDMRLSGSSPERIREISVVGTAYDSILGSSITYVSTPITSGSILYSAMDAAGVSSMEELKKDPTFFRERVIIPNIEAAEAVAQSMVAFGGAVISPAAFEAKSLNWSQSDYMGMWLDVIERKATRLALVDGWEYSNGGAEEYLQALLMQADRRDRTNITIVDARGQLLSHRQGIKLLAQAVENVLSRGFQPTVLAQVLNRCIILHKMVGDWMDYGALTDECGHRTFRLSDEYAQAMSEKAEMREIAYDLRKTMEAAKSIIPATEFDIRSSTELHPGLIRSSGRDELAQQPALVKSETKQ